MISPMKTACFSVQFKDATSDVVWRLSETAFPFVLYVKESVVSEPLTLNDDVFAAPRVVKIISATSATVAGWTVTL